MTEKLGKELPHAIDSERAIIGALIINNDLFRYCEGVLKAEFFYDKRHKLLYRVICDLHDKGYLDPLILEQRLHETEQLRDVGGREYIAEIADIGGSPINMPSYIEVVRDKAMLREIISTVSNILATSFNLEGKTPPELLDMAESRLSIVGDLFTKEYGGIQKLGDLTDEYISKMTEIIRTKNFDALRGTPSGFAGLDTMTGGLHRGELIILAGRPGSGKTAFGLNLVRHVSAQEKAGVIFFSLEMSAQQLALRMLSRDGLNMQKMRTGKGIGSSDLADLAQSAHNLENHEIYIDDSGTLNILEARARARRVKREMQHRKVILELVVVDYLQLMESSTEKGDNRALEVAVISRGLKALAKELDVPVIAMSQLNRRVETRTEGRPMLSDLRESGAIEQDADLVLFLHYKDKNKEDESEGPEEIDLIIGKQRNGPVGTVKLHFHKDFSKFTDRVFNNYLPPDSDF